MQGADGGDGMAVRVVAPKQVRIQMRVHPTTLMGMRMERPGSGDCPDPEHNQAHANSPLQPVACGCGEMRSSRGERGANHYDYGAMDYGPRTPKSRAVRDRGRFTAKLLTAARWSGSNACSEPKSRAIENGTRSPLATLSQPMRVHVERSRPRARAQYTISSPPHDFDRHGNAVTRALYC